MTVPKSTEPIEPTAPAEPLPSAGGSYTRNADGTLQRVDDTPPALTEQATPTTPQE